LARGDPRAFIWSAAAAAGLAVGFAARVSSYRFARKVVAITGASRGLGLCWRESSWRGERGWPSAPATRRSWSAPAPSRAPRRRGGAAVTRDVSDPQAGSFVAQAVEEYGRIDADQQRGTIAADPLESPGVEDFRAAMDANYFGTVYTTLAALPHLRRRSRIVNVCSIGGAVPLPHLLPYVGSKFAQVGFSQGLTAETARFGIKVSTVLPFVLRAGSHWQERAAHRILLACARGEAYVSVGLLAKAIRLVHGLAPGLVSRAAGMLNRLLPDPGEPVVGGRESERPRRTATASPSSEDLSASPWPVS
jgi:NAD(P)-dependent dehydrogenase (short-subunit alcohol dehydrogenase family)